MAVHAPAILRISCIPMLVIATSFSSLTKADPDCGTTFSWVTRALGPSAAGRRLIALADRHKANRIRRREAAEPVTIGAARRAG